MGTPDAGESTMREVVHTVAPRGRPARRHLLSATALAVALLVALVLFAALGPTASAHLLGAVAPFTASSGGGSVRDASSSSSSSASDQLNFESIGSTFGDSVGRRRSPREKEGKSGVAASEVRQLLQDMPPPFTARQVADNAASEAAIRGLLAMVRRKRNAWRVAGTLRSLGDSLGNTEWGSGDRGSNTDTVDASSEFGGSTAAGWEEQLGRYRSLMDGGHLSAACKEMEAAANNTPHVYNNTKANDRGPPLRTLQCLDAAGRTLAQRSVPTGLSPSQPLPSMAEWFALLGGLPQPITAPPTTASSTRLSPFLAPLPPISGRTVASVAAAASASRGGVAMAHQTFAAPSTRDADGAEPYPHVIEPMNKQELLTAIAALASQQQQQKDKKRSAVSLYAPYVIGSRGMDRYYSDLLAPAIAPLRVNIRAGDAAEAKGGTAGVAGNNENEKDDGKSGVKGATSVDACPPHENDHSALLAPFVAADTNGHENDSQSQWSRIGGIGAPRPLSDYDVPSQLVLAESPHYPHETPRRLVRSNENHNDGHGGRSSVILAPKSEWPTGIVYTSRKTNHISSLSDVDGGGDEIDFLYASQRVRPEDADAVASDGSIWRELTIGYRNAPLSRIVGFSNEAAVVDNGKNKQNGRGDGLIFDGEGENAVGAQKMGFKQAPQQGRAVCLISAMTTANCDYLFESLEDCVDRHSDAADEAAGGLLQFSGEDDGGESAKSSKKRRPPAGLGRAMTRLCLESEAWAALRRRTANRRRRRRRALEKTERDGGRRESNSRSVSASTSLSPTDTYEESGKDKEVQLLVPSLTATSEVAVNDGTTRRSLQTIAKFSSAAAIRGIDLDNDHSPETSTASSPPQSPSSTTAKVGKGKRPPHLVPIRFAAVNKAEICDVRRSEHQGENYGRRRGKEGLDDGVADDFLLDVPPPFVPPAHRFPSPHDAPPLVCGAGIGGGFGVSPHQQQQQQRQFPRLYPISFGTPLANMQQRLFPKLFDFHPVPLDGGPADGADRTVGLHDEDLMQSLAALSYYCPTHSRGGWDCGRHYEWLSAGCVPYFVDVLAMPPSVLPQLPKQLLRDVVLQPAMRRAPAFVVRAVGDRFRMDVVPASTAGGGNDGQQLASLLGIRFGPSRTSEGSGEEETPLAAFARHVLIMPSPLSTNTTSVGLPISSAGCDNKSSSSSNNAKSNSSRAKFQITARSPRLIRKRSEHLQRVPKQQQQELFYIKDGPSSGAARDKAVMARPDTAAMTFDKSLHDEAAYWGLARRLLKHSRRFATTGSVVSYMLEVMGLGAGGGDYVACPNGTSPCQSTSSASVSSSGIGGVRRALVLTVGHWDNMAQTVISGLNELGIETDVIGNGDWRPMRCLRNARLGNKLRRQREQERGGEFVDAETTANRSSTNSTLFSPPRRITKSEQTPAHHFQTHGAGGKMEGLSARWLMRQRQRNGRAEAHGGGVPWGNRLRGFGTNGPSLRPTSAVFDEASFTQPTRARDHQRNASLSLPRGDLLMFEGTYPLLGVHRSPKEINGEEEKRTVRNKEGEEAEEQQRLPTVPDMAVERLREREAALRERALLERITNGEIGAELVEWLRTQQQTSTDQKEEGESEGKVKDTKELPTIRRRRRDRPPLYDVVIVPFFNDPATSPYPLAFILQLANAMPGRVAVINNHDSHKERARAEAELARSVYFFSRELRRQTC